MLNNVVDFAYQIIEMESIIEEQARKIERLEQVEKDYHKLLDESLYHGQAMMGNMLKLFLTPGVIKVCEDDIK